MTTVAPLNIVRGTNITALDPYTAQVGGDKFPASGATSCYWSNSSGAPITVTLATPGTVRGLAIADLTVSVPAGGYAVQGPFPPDLFGDVDGLVSMTYSTNVGLKFGPFKTGMH